MSSRAENNANVTGMPFHVGLTPGLVVGAATDLTEETHLLAWSIRDLATRLGVAPSVIYHHVGGKDLLCRRVAERVFDGMGLPPSALDWQEWFRQMLGTIGPLAARFPGVAKWMLMHGPTIPIVLPVLEAGTDVLHRAGFGERAAFAFAVLINNALLTVSMGDDRLLHEADGPRDHATMMAEFRQMATASNEVRSLGQDFILPFAEGGEGAAAIRERYYRFVVDTTITGLAAHLDAREN